MPEPTTTVNWITVAFSFFGGGLIGTMASHYFTTRREKLARLNHFRGQLTRWRCHFFREEDPVGYYKSIAGDIAYECGVFLPDRPDMREALWRLYSLSGDDLAPKDGHTNRDVLIHHIHSIMGLVDAHPMA